MRRMEDEGDIETPWALEMTAPFLRRQSQTDALATHGPPARPCPPGDYGWHTVTDLNRRRGATLERFDVCPACWPAHTRVANELTRVQLNAPTLADSISRCHWCDARRAGSPCAHRQRERHLRRVTSAGHAHGVAAPGGGADRTC